MNITLNIVQCCTNNHNFTRVIEKSYLLTNINESIPLINGYDLSIILYTSNYIVIKLSDQSNIYIRVLHINYPFEMCFNMQNGCTYELHISTQIG